MPERVRVEEKFDGGCCSWNRMRCPKINQKYKSTGFKPIRGGVGFIPLQSVSCYP